MNGAAVFGGWRGGPGDDPNSRASVDGSRAAEQARRWEARGARRFRTVKGRMLSEFLDTLVHDPTSVRFMAPWVRSLLPGRNPIQSGLPWMNFKAIRWLRSYLRPGMRACEYGAGGSTLFVARRVRSLLSVESEPPWFEFVSAALAEAGVRNCELRLVPSVPARPTTDVTAAPSPYVSTAKGVAGRDFEAYVRTIDAAADGSLDLVLIDGYARLACVEHAVPKVRRGGHILVDDTDWSKYRRSFALLRRFPRTDFVGATPFQLNLRQTSVWRIT